MIVAMLTIFGLSLGSFVNALVWRLHKQSELNKSKNKLKSKKILTREQLSISRGHSMCPYCHHVLAPRDLVPVLSWLSLGGKCRYCHKPISWQYPAVEIATAILFVSSYIFWPGEGAFADLHSSINFIGWLIILTGFVSLFVYDLKWMLLPNRLVYPLLLLATGLAAYNIIAGEGVQTLYNTLSSVGIAGGIFFLLFQISNGRWIGGGDVKLGALIGLILADPFLAFLMLFSASSLGTLVVAPILAGGRVKASSRIPFGPFLIGATILVKLFGHFAVDWYKRSLGI